MSSYCLCKNLQIFIRIKVMVRILDQPLQIFPSVYSFDFFFFFQTKVISRTHSNTLSSPRRFWDRVQGRVPLPGFVVLSLLLFWIQKWLWLPRSGGGSSVPLSNLEKPLRVPKVDDIGFSWFLTKTLVPRRPLSLI